MRAHVTSLGPSVLLAALVGAQGCAGPQRRASPAPSAEAVQRAQQFFHVTTLGASPEDEVVVRVAAVEAVEVAQRWGTLRAPVNLKVHGTHAALEKAAHQENVPWMRGWARFDEVELEAPSGWGGDRAPQNVTELLSHELTHVVMYQRVGEADSWMRVQIPLWFREGMASVTSRQGYRRMTGEQLGAWLRQHPGDDPWLQADALAHGAQPVVYGAAHRAFEHLLAGHGDDAVGRILDALRGQATFDQAFSAGVGMEPQAFLAGFRRELEMAAADAGTAARVSVAGYGG